MNEADTAYLLNMTATYAPPASENAYGQIVPGTAVSLSSVYVEYTNAQNNGSLGEQERDDAILFFDSVNSVPQGQAFFNWWGNNDVDGNANHPGSGKPFYDPMSGLLHHWELALVGN